MSFPPPPPATSAATHSPRIMSQWQPNKTFRSSMAERRRLVDQAISVMRGDYAPGETLDSIRTRAATNRAEMSRISSSSSSLAAPSSRDHGSPGGHMSFSNSAAGGQDEVSTTTSRKSSLSSSPSVSTDMRSSRASLSAYPVSFSARGGGERHGEEVTQNGNDSSCYSNLSASEDCGQPGSSGAGTYDDKSDSEEEGGEEGVPVSVMMCGCDEADRAIGVCPHIDECPDILILSGKFSLSQSTALLDKAEVSTIAKFKEDEERPASPSSSLASGFATECGSPNISTPSLASSSSSQAADTARALGESGTTKALPDAFLSSFSTFRNAYASAAAAAVAKDLGSPLQQLHIAAPPDPDETCGGHALVEDDARKSTVEGFSSYNTQVIGNDGEGRCHHALGNSAISGVLGVSGGAVTCLSGTSSSSISEGALQQRAFNETDDGATSLGDTQDKERALAEYLSLALAGDEDLACVLPMAQADFYDALTDGIVLCKLVNLAAGGAEAVPRRKIVLEIRHVHQRTENLNLAISAAQSLGCNIVNTGASDFLEGNPRIVLGLVWQLVRMALQRRASVKGMPELLALSEPDEGLCDLMRLSPREFLNRWLTVHLGLAGCERTVEEFSRDLRDGAVYAHLLSRVGLGGGVDISSVRHRFSIMQRSVRRRGRFAPESRVSECVRESRLLTPPLGSSSGEIPARLRCGLGITFREDSHGRLHVHVMTPGGGAECGGELRVGDVLVEVDGEDVSKKRMDELAELCVGYVGDEVRITVRRPPSYEKVRTKIVRRAPRRCCVYA